METMKLGNMYEFGMGKKIEEGSIKLLNTYEVSQKLIFAKY